MELFEVELQTTQIIQLNILLFDPLNFKKHQF